MLNNVKQIVALILLIVVLVAAFKYLIDHNYANESHWTQSHPTNYKKIYTSNEDPDDWPDIHLPEE